MSVSKRTAWYFVSSIGGPLVSFATLPLFTLKLGPEQYGAFALGTAFAGAVSGVAGSVSTLNMPTQLTVLQGEDRRRYLAAALLVAFAIALGVASLIYWLSISYKEVMSVDGLSRTALQLALLSGVLNTAWVVLVEILAIEGKARTYSLLFFAQTLINAAVVSVALFSFDDKQLALFWGFGAAALFSSTSSLLALAQTVEFYDVAKWLRVAAHGMVSAVSASLSEYGKLAFERSLLAGAAGVAVLGLFAHAQYYKNASMTLINALSRGVLPTALEEAKADPPVFQKTRQIWILVQLFVMTVCMGFALIGRDVIGLLTNGKFSDAAPYAVMVLISLLLQTAAKPHATLLLARGQGKLYANLNTLSVMIAVGVLLIAVPLWGVWGVICSLFAQIIILKAGIYFYSRKIASLGFTDAVVVLGGMCALVIELLVEMLKPGLKIRLFFIFMMAPFFFLIFHKLKSGPR